MKAAEFYLPYFKQGDDLRQHLEDCGSVPEALERHATDMDAAAAKLRELNKAIVGRDVSIEADTHMILVEADEELIDCLVALGIAGTWSVQDESDCATID